MQPSSPSSTECQYAIARFPIGSVLPLVERVSPWARDASAVGLIHFQGVARVCPAPSNRKYGEWGALRLSFCSRGSFPFIETCEAGRAISGWLFRAFARRLSPVCGSAPDKICKPGTLHSHDYLISAVVSFVSKAAKQPP